MSECETAWINNMRILKEAGCSEKVARLTCDMLMSKESLVKENEELKGFIHQQGLIGEYYLWLEWFRDDTSLSYEEWKKEQSE